MLHGYFRQRRTIGSFSATSCLSAKHSIHSIFALSKWCRSKGHASYDMKVETGQAPAVTAHFAQLVHNF